MKGFKLTAAVFCCALSGAYVEAAQLHFNITGSQTGYAVTIPGMPLLTASMDPEEPSLSGRLIIDPVDPASADAFGEFIQPYFNIEYFNGSSTPVATVSFPANRYSFGFGSDAAWSYDAGTLTLTGTGGMSARGVTPFCVGLLTVCAGVWGQESGRIDLDMVLTFADTSLSSFTGVGTYTHTLANGTIVSGEYTFVSGAVSEIPVPAAAWLFGPAVMGLFGRKLRGSSRSVA